MKLRFFATVNSPDFYSISGEVITAYLDGVTAQYDLSTFPEGGMFTSADPVNGVTAIRGVERVDGELIATLCQQVGPGYWVESVWQDAAQYDPDAVIVVLDDTRPIFGEPWAKTRQGRMTPVTEETA